MDRYFFVFNDRDILLEKCTDGGYTIPYGKDVPVEGCDEKDMLTVTLSTVLRLLNAMRTQKKRITEDMNGAD